jgi:hypothetical protein
MHLLNPKQGAARQAAVDMAARKNALPTIHTIDKVR